MDAKAAVGTRTIALPDEGVEALFGAFDENLQFIESSPASASPPRGTTCSSKGEPAASPASSSSSAACWRCSRRATGSRTAT